LSAPIKYWKHQPSGLSSGLSFKVDTTWTPEQALAVWEWLDDFASGHVQGKFAVKAAAKTTIGENLT
jgi:hypothetical protein